MAGGFRKQETRLSNGIPQSPPAAVTAPFGKGALGCENKPQHENIKEEIPNV